MFKGKKGIIFDVDGTLLDSVWVWNEIDRALISKIGGVPDVGIVKERNYVLLNAAIQGNDVYVAYDEFLRVKYGSHMSLEEIIILRESIAENQIKNLVDFKQDADVFIKLARLKGFKLAIASLTPRKTLNLYENNKNIMSKCKFNEMFDSILVKEDVICKKPNPEVYLKSLSMLRLAPQECIIVEDSLVGVQAGKAAGVEVVNIYDEHSDLDREEIDRIADFCVKDYKQLIKELQEST